VRTIVSDAPGFALIVIGGVGLLYHLWQRLFGKPTQAPCHSTHLERLRDRYVADQITLEQFEEFVDAALRGTWMPLPNWMAVDMALKQMFAGPIRDVGEGKIAHSLDGVTYYEPNTYGLSIPDASTCSITGTIRSASEGLPPLPR
jgi:hypothetical protein